MAWEIAKAIILSAIVGCLLWFAYWFSKTLWSMLDDIADALAHQRKSPSDRYTFEEENMTCDWCGSGPWHIEWDPDSRTRKSRHFYCPNCTGAT